MEKAEASGVGDISVLETWKRLDGDPIAVPVDVRTRAERTFVGVADHSESNREVMLVERQTFPDSSAVPDFIERTKYGSGCQGRREGRRDFFICRSGGRSRVAAGEMV